MRAITAILLLLGIACCCCAQEIVREGNMEKLVLLPAADAGNWFVTEGTMATDTTRVNQGNASHHFHIDVDFSAGEKAYPIGWPRTNSQLKQDWQRDWSGFDFLSLWIYTQTSRETLPGTALGLVLHTPSRSSSHNVNLEGLKKDEWVNIQIPVSSIDNHEDVTLFQFYISESNYQDHDVLDFYIEDIALMRYAEPHLSEVMLRPAAAFGDMPGLALDFRASGIPEGEAVPCRVSLIADGAELLAVERDAFRGANGMAVTLGGGELPEGQYVVRAKLQGGEAVDLPLRVVASPWTEKKDKPKELELLDKLLQ